RTRAHAAIGERPAVERGNIARRRPAAPIRDRPETLQLHHFRAGEDPDDSGTARALLELALHAGCFRRRPTEHNMKSQPPEAQTLPVPAMELTDVHSPAGIDRR